jgi:hypothetical protein
MLAGAHFGHPELHGVVSAIGRYQLLGLSNKIGT